MTNWTANENVIEWIRGTDTVYVTLSEPKQINRVYRLQAKSSEVVIFNRPEENGGYLYAKMPLAFVRLFAPPKQSEEKRDRARLQLAKNKDAIQGKTIEKQEEDNE